jgi:hypothetical protein
MNTDISLEALNAEVKKAGLAAALQLSMTTNGLIEGSIPDVFGRKWKDFFTRVRDRLYRECGEDLQELIFVAHRWLAYAAASAAKTMTLYGADDTAPSVIFKLLCTPDGYIEYEGMASTLDEALSATDKPSQLLYQTKFSEMPSSSQILEAISVCWFFQAAGNMKNNMEKAHDLLFEAIDGAMMAYGRFMWDMAEEFGPEFDSVRTNAAAQMARMRHKENYALANTAVEYWREHIDPNLSASKAANQLVQIVPLSHKKLAELVSAEKKKII